MILTNPTLTELSIQIQQVLEKQNAFNWNAIIPLVVGIIGAVVTLIKYMGEKKKDREERFFEQRREHYQNFLSLHIEDIQRLNKDPNTLIDKTKANNNWEEFQREVIIWGSDDLIKKMNLLRYERKKEKIYNLYADVISQMRTDLGLGNKKNLDWKDIWKLLATPEGWEEIKNDLKKEDKS